MSQKKDGDPGKLTLDPVRQLLEVFDRAVPSARSELTQPVRSQGSPPVSPMIVCVYRVAVLRQDLRQFGVPARVFLHAVRYLDGGTGGLAVRQPLVDEYVHPVRVPERERRGFHLTLTFR